MLFSEDTNSVIHTCLTCLNLLVCCIICSTFYHVSKRPYNISNSLRIYFTFCLEPYGFLIILCSFITGTIYFINNDVNTMYYKILRMILAFCAIQIRCSYFMIVLSRISATIFYKSYSNYSGSTYSIVITIIITHLVSLCNGYFEFIRIFVDNNKYYFTIYIGLAEHFLTIIFCKVLYLVNRYKYKSIAYKSSLSERHQIYNNVKVLKTLWPIILMISLITPWGPLLVLFFKFVVELPSPTALYYVFYNLAFLFIICWKLSRHGVPSHHPINIIGKSGELQPSTKTLRGKVLPAIIPVEQYFDDLEKQWK